MIFHMSLRASDPAHVAGVLAEIWGGEAFPFHAVPGAWITLAGDAHGTALEICPDDTVLVPGEVAVEPDTGVKNHRHSASHVAAETALSEAEVAAIAKRENWLFRRCSRGPFDLLELWVENRFLIELLTPDMAADYRRTMTVDNWRSWAGSG